MKELLKSMFAFDLNPSGGQKVPCKLTLTSVGVKVEYKFFGTNHSYMIKPKHVTSIAFLHGNEYSTGPVIFKLKLNTGCDDLIFQVKSFDRLSSIYDVLWKKERQGPAYSVAISTLLNPLSDPFGEDAFDEDDAPEDAEEPVLQDDAPEALTLPTEPPPPWEQLALSSEPPPPWEQPALPSEPPPRSELLELLLDPEDREDDASDLLAELPDAEDLSPSLLELLLDDEDDEEDNALEAMPPELVLPSPLSPPVMIFGRPSEYYAKAPCWSFKLRSEPEDIMLQESAAPDSLDTSTLMDTLIPETPTAPSMYLYFSPEENPVPSNHNIRDEIIDIQTGEVLHDDIDISPRNLLSKFDELA